MAQQTDYLKDITQIRTMMERSSRFISLSGLAGVFAGIFALLGAAAAYFYLEMGSYDNYYEGALRSSRRFEPGFVKFLILDAIVILVLSIGAGIYFTTRKARKQGLRIWDKNASRLVINMLIPLAAGGIFCLALMYHGSFGLVAPATLIFYGISLINGSKYTLNDIRYLGISEIVLGLFSSFFIGYGFLFWALGFGVLHIIYGAVMYFKYEKQA